MATGDLSIQPIIGLEIHVQLRTRTKMFCGCPVRVEAPPNSCVCPVCLGHPGSLPVINQEAFHLAMITGMALQCTIARNTKWDRKSYFYPDLPKNYQISQYDMPLATGGVFEFPSDTGRKSIRIRRAHLEEDAGKNLHDTPGCTLVDLNRAGTPLLEIVTEPDLTTADDAYVFCTELQRLVVYLGVSDGVMQKGQMRFEPNVNVVIRSEGREFRTPICEIKNLNSFRAVRNAIAFEIDRHVAAWREDHEYVLGKRPNENRGWDDERGATEFQRSKESAHDYRYFPDPDLTPVSVDDAMISAAKLRVPELPLDRQDRLSKDYGLSVKDSETLLADRATADLFEDVVRAGGPAEVSAKQIVNVWLKLANDAGKTVAQLGQTPARLAELATIASDGSVNKTAANQIAQVMLTRPESPRSLAKELGLLQVRDSDATQHWVDEAFTANAQAVLDASINPKKLQAAAGFLRGQVMRISGGKADPRIVGELIERKLAELRDRNHAS